MIVLLLVLAGLVLGSFVNALVWRLHERRDWVTERSECPNCHHQLAAADLIPVFSWLLLHGKCRYCKKSIPDSPLVELALPALFVFSYAYWPSALQGGGLFTFIVWLVFLVGFLVLAVYDLRWFLLPDVVVFPFIGLAVLEVLGNVIFFGASWRDVLGSIIGVGVISGIFYTIFFLSKGRWIGFGDVKLGIVLGILAGGALPALLVLFAASLLGSLVAVPLVLGGKAGRKSLLPFGPLLIAGMIIVMLFGSTVVDWYTGLVVSGL